jgi:signal transduction histidine kinase
VVLVGVLAGLQYRWLGQVSEAEREQLARTLALRAHEFANDFDREIGQIYLAFQVQRTELEAAQIEQFAARLARWKSSARFPSLLKTVYWAKEEHDPSQGIGQRAEGRGEGTSPKEEAAPGALTLMEFRPDERQFVPVPWPEALAPVRNRLTPRMASLPNVPQGRAQIVTLGASSVFVNVPAVVVPVAVATPPVDLAPSIDNPTRRREAGSMTSDFLLSVRIGHQSLILLLDEHEITQTMLPALAERYFPEAGRDQYRIAIVDGKGTSILSRGLPAGATLDPKSADVAAPFFALRLESARGIGPDGHLMTWSLPAAATRSSPGSPEARGGQMSVFVEQRSVEQRSVVEAKPGVRVGLPGWHLFLQHADGSLDAAVANARRRNVWLSFGILAVLATGVCLIVLNARRSERLAAQQMDFVATVSHELRTPLAVIRSAAQNLSAGVVLDDSQARRYGDLIEGEGRRLTDMVEQVLEFAGLSSGRRPAHEKLLAVPHVIDEAVAASRALIDAHDFDLEIQVAGDLPPVSGDSAALHRALQNLIANALKHAASGRRLSVAARSATVRGRREVHIAVSDRGPGIDPDDLPHLFEPFYRGREALERQVQGNGLGLSLVKRIAESLGGRVSVRSAPGEGSTFTLQLPAAAPHAAADAAIEHPEPV